MVEDGKKHPSQEDKAQKGSKQARVGQKGVDQRGDSQVAPLSWTPTLMLDGAHLPANASIRDFRGGKAGYVVDVVEQALLILEDMADLGSLRRHEVFLSLKRDLVMVSLKFTLFLLFSFFTSFLPLLPFTISLYSPLPCFFPRQAVQATFRAEEITNFCHRQMKEEEGRRNATVEAFNLAEKRISEMKCKIYLLGGV